MLCGITNPKSVVASTDSLIQVVSGLGVMQFAQLVSKFPNVQKFLEQSLLVEKIEFTITDGKEEVATFYDVFVTMLSEMQSPVVKVSFTDEGCKLEASGRVSYVDIDFTTAQDKPINDFYINGKYFLEGLLSFTKCEIADKWIRFSNDVTECIVLKADVNKN